MFAIHQNKIENYAARGPTEFGRVLTFVLLTIQQPLDTVPAAMKDVDREGIESKYLWGFKRDAYEHMIKNREPIYHDAMELSHIPDPEIAERQLLAYFAAMPGLGLVKAGFVLQLAFGLGGCVDGHNVKRFELDKGRKSLPQFLRANQYKAVKPATRARFIDQYQALLKIAGGCEDLWDDWCIYVQSRAPGRYASAHEVSELHCTSLGIN